MTNTMTKIADGSALYRPASVSPDLAIVVTESILNSRAPKYPFVYVYSRFKQRFVVQKFALCYGIKAMESAYSLE